MLFPAMVRRLLGEVGDATHNQYLAKFETLSPTAEFNIGNNTF